MSDSAPETQAEEEELERRIGWFPSHCGCEGHVIMRTKHLVEMRAGAPLTPERVFVPAPPRDPNEPKHTHQYAEQGEHMVRAVMECPGCRWQAETAAAFYEEHPDQQPEWVTKLVTKFQGRE